MMAVVRPKTVIPNLPDGTAMQRVDAMVRAIFAAPPVARKASPERRSIVEAMDEQYGPLPLSPRHKPTKVRH